MIEIAEFAMSDCYAGARLAKVLDRFGRDFFETAAGGSGQARTVAESLPAVFEKIELRSQGNGRAGIKTGFSDLDNLTAGLQPSDLIILAARPSMGKTALAMRIAENAARQGRHVLMFSLEMSSAQLQERLLSRVSGVSLHSIIRGELTEGDWSRLVGAWGTLQTLPITIDDRAGLSIGELRAVAKATHARNPVGLIVVDYLQLLHGTGETVSFSNITTRLEPFGAVE